MIVDCHAHIGTDYPLTTASESLKIFREDLPAAAERMGLPMVVPGDALDQILGEDATRLYQLV